MQGQVGYGDQTDLFGPSGLENIFAQSRPVESPTRKTRSSMNWLEQSAVGTMPSSPPPWPSRMETYEEEDEDAVEEKEYEGLSAVNEESQYDEEDGSFRSNPFDLRHSAEPASDEQQRSESVQHSSPQRPVGEQTHDNIAGNRTVSGQTELDDFSPVFISKHTTMNGQVEYKALDSRLVKEFQNQTVNLKHPSQERLHSELGTSTANGGVPVDSSTFTDGPESASLPAVPDLSLSENLPTGTPPSAALGENVQLQRGGYSNNGSFRDRPLSASQSTAGPSNIVGETSGLLSPLPTYGRQRQASRSVPSTPVAEERVEPRSRSSGSPLKLFGPHDTFTSNRLLRRMSQLDPDLSAIRSEPDSETSTKQRQGSTSNACQRAVSGGSFGSGELNDHGFNAEITITSASDSDKSNSDRSPGSEVLPPGSHTPHAFRVEDLPVSNDTFKLKRKLSKRSEVPSKESTLASKKHLQPSVEDAQDTSAGLAEGRPSDNSAFGKRPPNSPFKAPTPKRRRTLHASELEEGASQLSRSYHTQLQDAISSQKRRDSRPGDYDVADPAILAQRKILRPRNPTPSQSRRDEIEAQIRATAEQFAEEEPEALEAVMEQIESSMATDTPPSIQQQANVVAQEVAKFSLRIQKASGDYTERKRSVTTQDFFNEAVMVMRLIREKAGRQSGLGSVAESDQEAMAGTPDLEHSNVDSPSLRFSRPPSREGGSGWRPRTSEQTDARVISHLRKYQERDDTEFIAPSVASLDAEDEEEEYVAVDEHSNIRIKGPLHTRDTDDPSRPSTQHSQQSSVASQSSQHSDATSTGRTLLSRKSDNVGCLAPDAVAHLIGEQVGAMTYDKDKQQWVKAKSPKKPQYGSFLEPPSNITSDDDPFREISDLPVDEHKEEEIRKASTGRRPSALADDLKNAQTQGKQDAVESRTTSQETVLARPTTGDSKASRHAYSSSDATRYTALASSQHQTNETRATSWGNEELAQLAAQGKARQQPLAYAAAQAALALAQRNMESQTTEPEIGESEISYPSAPHPTVETQTAPSAEQLPIEESIQEESAQDESDVLADLRDDTAVVEESEIEDLRSPRVRRAQTLPQPQATPGPRAATREMSLRRKTLTSRFNDADMMEQSELSFVAPLPGERMMSVSLSVSRPMSKRQAVGRVLDPQSSPTKYDPSFMLSDLPEFTVHEEDHERPSERALAQRLAAHAAAEIDDRYALSVKDLVKILTDVKEDEPYWENIKQLDLHDRALASLHGLSDFCGSVQDIDISDNKLSYLNGAPATIRQLIARGNQLSSLTPWNHLMNLQYLDISGNQLQSLDGLSCLIHLRELRADDNEITSLDGIMGLDGLLKLRARRNMVQDIDFSPAHLYRLEELDLVGNSVGTVRSVESLPRLERLIMDGNALAEPFSALEEMPNLKHLSLQGCRLQHLDVRHMPALRTLLLDDNSLSTVAGVEHLRSLDLLSLRKQTLPEGRHVTTLEEAVQARTIRLSGNELPFISLPHGLLSLQHLEMASVGLQDLPDDFGLKLPNLVTLNLNFNSLKDVRPLLNIQKLQQVSMCGNRLSRLRKNVAALSKITTLTSIDLRDNPLTQGFYPSIGAGTQHTSVVRRTPSIEKEDEDLSAERREANKYILPAGDSNLHATHSARLDEDTLLRRRVYQLLLGNCCEKLASLDGLAFDRMAALVRDRTWERLVQLGIVRKSGGVGMKGDVQTP